MVEDVPGNMSNSSASHSYWSRGNEEIEDSGECGEREGELRGLGALPGESVNGRTDSEVKYAKFASYASLGILALLGVESCWPVAIAPLSCF